MSTTNNNSQTTLPFYEAVLKRKITQICEDVGYHATSHDSLNLLSDLYEKTIKQLGTHCKDYANRNRRSEVALVDLVRAYDYIGISIPELKEYINEVKLPFPVEIERDEPEPTNRVQRNLIEEEKEGQQSIEVANDTENSDEITPDTGPELMRNRFQELINKFDDCSPVSAVKYEIPKPVKVVPSPKPKLKVKVKVKPPLKKNKGHKEKQQTTLKIPTLSIITSRQASPIHESIPSPKPIKVKIEPPPATVRDPTPTPTPPLPPKQTSPLPQPSTSLTPPPLTPGAQDVELCPSCNLPDDGSMMIQCDNGSCARWFHGNCVGVTKELEEDATWFCNQCSKPKKVPHKQRSSKKNIELKPKSSKKNRLKESIKLSTKPLKTPTPPVPIPVQTPPLVIVSAPAPVTSGIHDIDLCPTCNLPDDGSMMIQCDDPTCARWFHGNCVGLEREPADDESWFCKGCIEKQQSAFSSRRRVK